MPPPRGLPRAAPSECEALRRIRPDPFQSGDRLPWHDAGSAPGAHSAGASASGGVAIISSDLEDTNVRRPPPNAGTGGAAGRTCLDADADDPGDVAVGSTSRGTIGSDGGGPSPSQSGASSSYGGSILSLL
jgi:hypothetical protein